jgi:phosphohistidine phosphatase
VDTDDPGRTLLLLRHAKSSQPEGVADIDRPLSDRGRSDGWAAGQQLAAWGVRCDLVLCSPAVRTRETWERAEQGGAVAHEVSYRDEIYEASWPELVELIRTVPDTVATLLVVGHGPARGARGGLGGHGPGVPGLAHELVADDATPPGSVPGAVELAGSYPTSGLARLRIRGSWADLDPAAAELVEFVVPRG